MKTLSLISALLVCILYCQAQTLEFSEPVKLPASVNSAAEESLPLFSPESKRLYFARSLYNGNTGGRFAGLDIWLSQLTETGWKAATNKLGDLNDKDNNVLIGVNRDGKTVYTMDSSPSGKLEGFSFSRFNGSSWSKPEFVALPGIHNQDFVGLFVSPDYDVIFISMKGEDTHGEEDIYVSVKDSRGRWGRPKNIGTSINTNGFEIAPFLSADKKRLYFASNGHGGFGDADIFYSDRLYNSWETWSTPVNLGSMVNSKKFDSYFSIYGDTLAFFCSNREGQLSDIYSAKVSVKNNLLASGEEYLSQDEWNKLIGKNVGQTLTFQNKSMILTKAQKEYLYFLANKVAPNDDLKFQIVVKQEEDPETSRSRLREIYGELRQAGIDSNRIREEHRSEHVDKGETGLIEVLVFKTTSN